MTSKEECEILLEALIPACKDLLKKNEEFYPIGATLSNDNTVKFTAVDFGDNFPDTKSMIDSLVLSHKKLSKAKEIKAVGTAWNATSSQNGKLTDTIIVKLEHKDGYCVIVGLPYKIGLFKRIKEGELFAQEGEAEVFQAVKG